MNELAKKIFDEMERKKYNIIKVKIIIILILLSIVLALYDLITSIVSKQVTVISAKSLDDPELKKKLIGLCNDLVNNQSIQDDLTNLLSISINRLCEDKQIQNKIVELLTKTIEDEITKEKLKDLVKEEVRKLSEDKEVQNNLANLVYESIKRKLFR